MECDKNYTKQIIASGKLLSIHTSLCIFHKDDTLMLAKMSVSWFPSLKIPNDPKSRWINYIFIFRTFIQFETLGFIFLGFDVIILALYLNFVYFYGRKATWTTHFMVELKETV